jgi:hypothetical protein
MQVTGLVISDTANATARRLRAGVRYTADNATTGLQRIVMSPDVVLQRGKFSAGREFGTGPPLFVVDSLADSLAFQKLFDAALPVLRLESHQPHRATCTRFIVRIFIA